MARLRTSVLTLAAVAFKQRGVPAICLEAWHARAALSAMRNKTDKADARGIAHIMRAGWFREVHIKSEESYRLRLLLTQRRNLKRKFLDIENAIRHSIKTFGLRIGRVGRGQFEARVRELEGTANGRAIRHGVLRRFCDYLAIYDARTEALNPRALSRSRAIPPPRILSDAELGSLMSACRRVSPGYPERGVVLTMLVGLLASTGLRSGEALRLDRADVDLAGGVLHIRKTKFRKDRLVPVHTTTLAALRQYARHRDAAFPASKDTAFFLSSRGNRLSAAGLYAAFDAACALAGLDSDKGLRPHDLRHNSGNRIIPATDRQRACFRVNRGVAGA